MKITFREYQKEDFKILGNIIRETWHYDEFSSPKTAVKLARVFFEQLLNKLYVFTCCFIEQQTDRNYFSQKYR